MTKTEIAAVAAVIRGHVEQGQEKQAARCANYTDEIVRAQGVQQERTARLIADEIVECLRLTGLPRLAFLALAGVPEA